MQRFLLFIRETGNEDIADVHPDEASARTALAAYVRARERNAGVAHHSSDDAAITEYFRSDQALYAITCVGAGC